MARWELESEQRLRTLDETGLLPGLRDEAFDSYTRLVARLLDVPVALVSFVNGECQFFPAAIGLDEPWATEARTPLSMSFCKHVVVNDDVLRVADARTDDRVRDNLAVSELSVVAYLGVPLRAPTGEPLGSLCAIDARPRTWTDDDVATLRDIADAASTLVALRTAEEQQRESAAQASHQLRTPLTAARLKLEDLAAWDEVNDDVGEALREVVDDIGHLSRLVDRLVADAREHGRSGDTGVDLVAIAALVVARWNDRLSPSRRTVTLDAGGPALVRGSPDTLGFLVDALAGRVATGGSGSITVRVTHDAATVRLLVTDEGSTAAPGPDGRADLAGLAHRVGAHLRVLPPPVVGYELVLPPETST